MYALFVQFCLISCLSSHLHFLLQIKDEDKLYLCTITEQVIYIYVQMQYKYVHSIAHEKKKDLFILILDNCFEKPIDRGHI